MTTRAGVVAGGRRDVTGSVVAGIRVVAGRGGVTTPGGVITKSKPREGQRQGQTECVCVLLMAQAGQKCFHGRRNRKPRGRGALGQKDNYSRRLPWQKPQGTSSCLLSSPHI